MTVIKNAEVDPKFITNLSAKPIGEGGFGVVFKAEYAGVVVAIKKVDLSRLSMKEKTKIFGQFQAELKIMHGLRHPCIVDILGAITTDPNELSLVMQFVEKGDLRGILDSEYGR